MALQHLRTSTANKRPTPAGMSEGQLALNTNDASPGLFFKDSNGALVKVGPVHVGTTAPNATPGSGGSSGNAIGEQWLDTTGGTYVFKVWDGSAWRSESGTFVDVNGDVMTGALGIIAGSAGSPGLYFSGDTNTGLYSPGADQLAISTNGTKRLQVDAGGNVSIDAVTNTGLKPLAIYSQARDCEIRLTTNSGTSNDAYVTLRQSGGNLDLYSTNGAITLNPANTERLRITSAGLVGVGTSSPGKTLDVNGESRCTVAATINNGAAWYTAGDPGGYLYLGNAIGTPASIESYTPSSRSSAAQLELRFKTVNTGGSAVTAMTIDSSQRIGVGTASASAILHTKTAGGEGLRLQGTDAADFIRFTNATDTSTAYIGHNTTFDIFNQRNTDMRFGTNDAERLRIDSSGRLLVGTSSARSNYFGAASGEACQLQVEGNDYKTSGASFTSTNNTIAGWGPHIALGRSRGGSVGTNGLVSNGDGTGSIIFHGNDGSSFIQSARIDAFVDGTPGANDMPGRLVFSTTADGASSPAEQLRITSDRYVRLASGTGGIQFGGDTAAANALDDYEEGTFTPSIVGTSTAGTATYGANGQQGRYTKIGNRVFFDLYLAWSAHTGTGDLQINGLPFTVQNTTNLNRTYSAIFSSLTLTAGSIGAAFSSPNTTNIALRQLPTGGGSVATVPMDTSAQISISGSFDV